MTNKFWLKECHRPFEILDPDKPPSCKFFSASRWSHDPSDPYAISVCTGENRYEGTPLCYDPQKHRTPESLLQSSESLDGMGNMPECPKEITA